MDANNSKPAIRPMPEGGRTHGLTQDARLLPIDCSASFTDVMTQYECEKTGLLLPGRARLHAIDYKKGLANIKPDVDHDLVALDVVIWGCHGPGNANSSHYIHYQMLRYQHVCSWNESMQERCHCLQ